MADYFDDIEGQACTAGDCGFGGGGSIELMVIRKRQLKWALESLREALDSHHRSLERLERALIEVEETLTGGEDRQERPQDIRQGGEAGRGLDLLSLTEVSQELGRSKSWVYRRIRSGEISSIKLGHNIKVRREDLEGYLEDLRYQPGFGVVD